MEKEFHYVYYSYEEWGRGYIGVRTCNQIPTLDVNYFGSFKDKTFNPTQKIILEEFPSREEAVRAEIKLHDFFDVARNPHFSNRSKQTSTRFDTTGVPHKTETKEKMSETRTGELNSFYGKSHTEEYKRRRSEKYSGGKHPLCGTKRPDNAERTGEKHPRSKKVEVTHPDGTVEIFPSAKSASDSLEYEYNYLKSLARENRTLRWGRLAGFTFRYLQT